MTILTQTTPQVNFTPHGYPINPATGKMYSRAEIVADASIPLPTFVDPINPPPYWQRRSADELAAETKRIAAKNKRNAAARERRHSSKHTMDNRIAYATLALVERVNRPAVSEVEAIERFTNETAPVNAQDVSEIDGPRNFGESIMELLGQDYKAERERLTAARMRKPTAEEAQRGLEIALGADPMNLIRNNRAQFGRGR
jgi:hypothetical protein